MKLKIEYLPVDSLTPYEGNARRHSPTDIESIKISIQNDGFNDPIGIWGENNIIVEGHGRQIAARELGMETVPCIRLDHLTEQQRKEYAIRHNRTSELSTWDFEKLEQEMAELALNDIDMSDLKLSLDVQDFGEVEAPAKFKEFDEGMETKHVCPRCGYEWN